MTDVSNQRVGLGDQYELSYSYVNGSRGQVSVVSRQSGTVASFNN
jgi:hypothetical protein